MNRPNNQHGHHRWWRRRRWWWWGETLYFSCYFCCFYEEAEDEEEEEEEVEAVAAMDNAVIVTTVKRFDVRAIGRFLRDIAACGPYNMPAIEAHYYSEIDRLIDQTSGLHEEIRMTLKHLYRARESRELNACIARVFTLLSRWNQPIPYEYDAMGETFDSIIVILDERQRIVPFVATRDHYHHRTSDDDEEEGGLYVKT